MVRDGQTRERFLEVALHLFAEQGYDGTTVDDIVAEVGVTPPSLYHHFGSKEGLLRAVVDPLVEALDDLVARAPGVNSSAESRRPVLEEYLQILLRWRTVVCFLIDDPAVRHHPEVGARLRRQQSLLQSLLAGDQKGAPAAVAAEAALGAVWRPVTALDEDQVDKHSKTIVDAAVGALAAVLPWDRVSESAAK